MNKLLLTLVFFIAAFTAASQSYNQQQLIRSFFQRSDVKDIVQTMGHPTPDHDGIKVTSISDNSVYFEAYYSSGLVGDYTCSYRLDLSSYGKFSNIRFTHCGNPGLFGIAPDCFDAMDFSRVMNYLDENGEALTSSHPAVKIQEEMRGKALDRFSAREVLCAALFCIWYDEGYYRNY